MKGPVLLLPALGLASALVMPRMPGPAENTAYYTLAEVTEMHRRGELEHLTKRDDCSYDVPAIDKTQDNCPKKVNKVDGKCPIKDDPDIIARCSSYCEETIRFFYGEEVPFGKNIYGDKEPVTITEAETVTHSTTWAFSGDITFGKIGVPGTKEVEAAFKFGVSYSFTDSFSSTLSNSASRPKDEERRGRFAAIPVMYQSCGQLNSAGVETRQEFGMGLGESILTNVDHCSGPQEQAKICQTPSYLKDKAGKNMQIIVFVALCHDLDPCPEGQDEAYYHDGVSLSKEFAKNKKPDTHRGKAKPPPAEGGSGGNNGPPPPPPPPPPPNKGGKLDGPCDKAGFYNCIDGHNWQQCGSGFWSPPQPMAAGLTCKVGQSPTLG